MKGGLLMELKHYPQLTVEKITGEHTKFYPYKINWIISQLPLNQDQKDNIIQDLTNYFNNYQDDLITTANIYNQLINVLTNHNYYKAKEQVKDYHQKIQHEFKQATNPVHKIDQLREGDKNITNENANKDSRVYSTQRDLLAGSASRAIGLSMLPPLVAKAHQRGDIHWHDLDYSPFTTETNCCLPNFRDMLQNGFKLGNAWVSSPKSIEVAVTLISEIITSIAGSQYGGQSCNRLDEVLAPYAKLNYDKHLKEAEDWVEPDKQENFAKKRTIHDITNAMQSLEYNINMMMSTQGQTPFVTVNFGLGTSWIEREIQKAILNVRIKGLGRERRTAVFPKLVFTLKKGINLNPSDPNYDIKQLAIKCSTRRIYPDILNYDNIVKITGSFKSPMGAVAGNEMITWKDFNGTHITNFKTFWNEMANRYQVKPQLTNGDDYYIDIPDKDLLQIKDSHTDQIKFVNIKRIINNQGRTWKRIKFNNGRYIECTPDHPFEIKGRGRIEAQDLHVGDQINTSLTVPSLNHHYFNNNIAWLLGILICDGCLNENTESIVSYNIVGENEIQDRIVHMYPTEKLRYKEHHRGKRGDYKELTIKDKWLENKATSLFHGVTKNNRQIPTEIFNATTTEREYFMAGMIDADGYINNNEMCQIGSTNKSLALGQLLLAQSLGFPARMYVNHYSKTNPRAVRYRIEFSPNQSLVQKIACQKKQNHFQSHINMNDIPCTIEQIDTVDSTVIKERAYDVTTESDYFDVSGIVSHNCRSFLQGWINPETGKDEEDGRMNLGVVTVNLPRIALEAHGDQDLFWEIFNERMAICHQALKYRIARCKQAKPENAPILFEYGAFGRLKPDEDVDKLFRNSRATVSLGYIGLYEVNTTFYGPNWEHNPKAHAFAELITKRMHDLCAKWEDAEGYHYSLYSTPQHLGAFTE